MGETPENEPYGPSPYDKFREEVAKVEDLAGMHWTNNVWQVAPTTPEEVEECWDEAMVSARRIEDAANALSDAIYRHRAALRRQIDDEADAAALAGSQTEKKA